jgi:hypothetical protein
MGGGDLPCQGLLHFDENGRWAVRKSFNILFQIGKHLSTFQVIFSIRKFVSEIFENPVFKSFILFERLKARDP